MPEEAADFLSERLLGMLHLSLLLRPPRELGYHYELDTSGPILKYCDLPHALVCGAEIKPPRPLPEPTVWMLSVWASPGAEEVMLT